MLAHPQDSLEIYQKRIHRAVARIDADLSEPLDLNLLANEAGFSPYHFSRIFTAVMGETPMKYVLRLRMECAANLLIKSTRNLTQIAMDSGFSSPSTFTRAFNRFYGCSPSAFRRRWAYPTDSDDLRSGDERINKSGFSISAAKIIRMPAQPVVYTATYFGYSRANICDAWVRLQKWAMLHQLLTPATRALGISLDDPFITRPERCRYYACLTVASPQESISSRYVQALTIPAGEYAVFDVRCFADDLKYAYQNIFSDWLLKSGYQPANAFLYEVYAAQLEQDIDAEMEVQIHIPIEPIGD